MKDGGISRRFFNKAICLLSLSPIWGEILPDTPGFCHVPAARPVVVLGEADFSQERNGEWYPGLNCRMVGTGEHGAKAVRSLFERPRAGRALNGKEEMPFKSLRIMPEPYQIRKELEERDLIVLCGKKGDPLLFKIRDVALTCEPSLLLTFMVGSAGNRPNSAPSECEGVILAPEHFGVDETADWLQYLCCAIGRPEPLGVDSADLKIILAGGTLHLHAFEAYSKRDMVSLDSQWFKVTSKQKKYRRIMYILSWSDPGDVNMHDFAAAYQAISKSIAEDADAILMIVLCSHISRSYFRMSLLCREEAPKYHCRSI